jgi:hypothetical protein
MIFAVEFVATFCTGLFAGAALYITVVEHPARMECGTALAATEFGPSYRRATVMQASLAIVSFIAAITSLALTSNYAWLLGGILIVAVIPFTHSSYEQAVARSVAGAELRQGTSATASVGKTPRSAHGAEPGRIRRLRVPAVRLSRRQARSPPRHQTAPNVVFATFLKRRPMEFERSIEPSCIERGKRWFAACLFLPLTMVAKLAQADY